MNKTEIKRAKRIVSPETFEPLDYETGDLVQVVADGKRAAGQIGTIIGIQLRKCHGRDMFFYTVRFSNKDSIRTTSNRLRFLSRENKYRSSVDE